jgi:hypothetical protein
MAWRLAVTYPLRRVVWAGRRPGRSTAPAPPRRPGTRPGPVRVATTRMRPSGPRSGRPRATRRLTRADGPWPPPGPPRLDRWCADARCCARARAVPGHAGLPPTRVEPPGGNVADRVMGCPRLSTAAPTTTVRQPSTTQEPSTAQVTRPSPATVPSGTVPGSTPPCQGTPAPTRSRSAGGGPGGGVDGGPPGVTQVAEHGRPDQVPRRPRRAEGAGAVIAAMATGVASRVIGSTREASAGVMPAPKGASRSTSR